MASITSMHPVGSFHRGQHLHRSPRYWLRQLTIESSSQGRCSSALKSLLRALTCENRCFHPVCTRVLGVAASEGPTPNLRRAWVIACPRSSHRCRRRQGRSRAAPIPGDPRARHDRDSAAPSTDRRTLKDRRSPRVRVVECTRSGEVDFPGLSAVESPP